MKRLPQVLKNTFAQSPLHTKKRYWSIKPMFQSGRWRLHPGDTVLVRAGPHKGQTGKILEVIKDKRVPHVIVEGVNMRKRKIELGGGEPSILTMEAPLHYSQVNLLEPEAPVDLLSDTPTVQVPAERRWVRAGIMYLADGTRLRVGRHSKNSSGQALPIPEVQEPKSKAGGPKDTEGKEVMRTTRTEPNSGPDALLALAAAVCKRDDARQAQHRSRAHRPLSALFQTTTQSLSTWAAPTHLTHDRCQESECAAGHHTLPAQLLVSQPLRPVQQHSLFAGSIAVQGWLRHSRLGL